MPVLTANRVKVSQKDFSGGQNSNDEPSKLKENEAELLENCIIRERGRLEQRRGLSRVGDSTDELLGHWTFDASTAEDDESTNDGTASSVTYVDGKFGKCASFNGSTSSIVVAAASALSGTTMGAFRLSAWVYVDSDGEGNVGRIIDNWTGSKVGYRLYVFGESSSTVKVAFEVGYSTTNALIETTTTISTGAWHKIDAIHNADKSLDVYLDGAIATYATDTTGVGTIGDDSANDIYFGNNSTGAYTFDGEIDDIRIYDGAYDSGALEIKTILGITRYNVGSTYDSIIRAKGSSIQELSSDFKTWDDITGLTSLTTGLTTNFIQGNDRLFILNGTDNVHSIDSSLTVTDEGNTNTDFPLTTFAEWTPNNRMFASGSLTDSERDYVWFSNSLDPQTWNRATNYFAVSSGKGGKVTWLKTFKGFELIIYKNSSIYVLGMDGATPLTDWSVQPLSIAVGCPAGRTVQDIGNDHIFLANDGVRLLSRTTFDKLKVGIISNPIQDVIERINQDAVASSVGYFEDGYYILGIPVGTSTIPNKFLIWDSVAASRNGDPNSAWTVLPDDVWNLSCITSFGFGDNALTIVAGEARALSLCYKVFSGNHDNGSAVIQTMISREQDFGDPFIQKIFDPSQCIAETGSDAYYNYSMDADKSGFVSFGATSILSGGLVTPFTTPATTGGADIDSTSIRTKFIGRGKTIRIKVINSTYNKRPTFLEYTVYSKPYQGRI